MSAELKPQIRTSIMGGGYISCDDFHGEDKSGSAIFGVFEELPGCLPEDHRMAFISGVIEPLKNQLDETGEYFLIESDVAHQMQPAVESLFARLKDRFGDADVWQAIEMDNNSGLDGSDAKWGKGAGWQYYCVTDLRIVLEKCIASEKPICICFD